MTKVNYNGQEIELEDEFEKGFVELDLITDDEENEELENTIEIDIEDLENTKEFTLEDLNNTEDLEESLGNINE